MGTRLTPEQELKSLAINTYLVNEKRPPSYDRKWKLYVLHSDREGLTYWGDDSEAGKAKIFNEALRDARRKSETTV